MSHWERFATVAVLMVAVSGCSGTTSPGGAPKGDRLTQSHPISHGRWTEVASVDVPFRELNHLQVDGETVVFAHASRGESGLEALDHVGAIDWPSGDYTRVASTTFPDGKIDWPEIAGDWVFFSESDRVPSMGDAGARWRLHAVPLNGQAEHRLIGHSPGTEPSWEPLPEAGEDDFAWFELENPSDPGEGLRIRSWSAKADTPTDVMRNAKISGYQPTPQGLVFTQKTRSFGDGDLGLDLFLLEANSDQPKRLTDRGLVGSFDVDGTVLVWEERREPRQPNGSPGPWDAVWTADLSRPWTEHRLTDRPHRSNVAAGSSGIAAWWDGKHRVLVSWPGQEEPLKLPGISSVPPRIAADDDLVVWATERRDGHRIHIAEIEQER